MTLPTIIGIAGPSCAGKTALAEALAARLEDAALLALDRYYKDLAHLPLEERAQQDFDHPDALEWPRVLADLAQLCQGKPARVPSYDFAAHVRRAEDEVLAPPAFLVVEGIHALHHEALTRLYRLRVFVDAPPALCQARRIHRDVAERGRHTESVERQFRASVWPAYEQFVRPAKARAELVLEGTEPLYDNAERIVRALDSA
jgi:uridine kinase